MTGADQNVPCSGAKVVAYYRLSVLCRTQRYGLVGPNGQGKSTLMMHIAHKRLAIPEHIDVLMVEQVLDQLFSFVSLPSSI
jgi:ATPase subunit of ABC transporter with duplicated ATPase domains